ncbi:MAG: transcriptional regulator MntR [Bacillota bacterium]
MNNKNDEFHTFRGYQMLKQKHEQLTDKMTASMEDYLEMIYRNCLKEGFVRTNQLAGQLNVQASSVTKIVQKLTEFGLLDYQKYGVIQLTDKGKVLGGFLLNRHLIVENFLRIIGVNNDFLLRDTEMIEHHLSDNTVQQIKQLYRFFKHNPHILKQFRMYKSAQIKKNGRPGR